MKRIMSYGLALIIAVFSISVYAEEIIHYWNFNENIPESSTNWTQPIPANIGSGTISYNFTQAYSFSGTDLNGIDAEVSGGAFCPRGGTVTDEIPENNGNFFVIYSPTTYFKNIGLSYIARRTATGFATQTISYSLNGAEFIDITVHNVPESSSWESSQVVNIDFSSIPETNNNPYFHIRFTLDGASTASGNNRIDNIKLSGDLSSPSELSYEIENNTVHLSWLSPIPEPEPETDELIYDNNNVTGGIAAPGYTLGVQMSPTRACQILELQYYTMSEGLTDTFNAEIYNFDGTNPAIDVSYELEVVALDENWTVVDVSNYNLFMENDFMVGFGSYNMTTFLAFDTNYNNNRSWQFEQENSQWDIWHETYIIRALVMYYDGRIETLSPNLPTQKNTPTSTRQQIVIDYNSTLPPVPTRFPHRDFWGYNIYRDSVQINNEPVTETTYSDIDLAEGVYSYWVTAVYSMGESAISNIIEVEVEDQSDITDINTPLFKNSLGNNYPNPFNPSTTINFSLQEYAPVKIEIFNLKGQKIKTLIDGVLDSGNHLVIWNGSSDDGLKVSSGFYFYKMQTEDYSSAKEMLLLK